MEYVNTTCLAAVKMSPFSNIYIYTYTLRCRYNAVNFLPNPHNGHPLARPSGLMSFVNLNFDSYSASVNAVLYDTSCYTGPGYNGTRLHIYDSICAIKPTTESLHLSRHTNVVSGEHLLYRPISIYCPRTVIKGCRLFKVEF